MTVSPPDRRCNLCCHFRIEKGPCRAVLSIPIDIFQNSSLPAARLTTLTHPSPSPPLPIFRPTQCDHRWKNSSEHHRCSIFCLPSTAFTLSEASSGPYYSLSTSLSFPSRQNVSIVPAAAAVVIPSRTSSTPSCPFTSSTMSDDGIVSLSKQKHPFLCAVPASVQLPSISILAPTL